MSLVNSVIRNRFEELLGQAIEQAIDGGITADEVREALVTDWDIILREKLKRDLESLRKAL